jgi:hypothetical protein
MYYFIQYFVILDCLKNYKSRFNKTKKATVLLWTWLLSLKYLLSAGEIFHTMEDTNNLAENKVK